MTFQNENRAKQIRAQIDNLRRMGMNAEKSICIFSLSTADIFKSGVNEAVKWLKEKRQEPSLYHFREKKPRNLLPGSIVMFSIERQIIGQAIVKEGVKETPLERKKRLKEDNGFDYKFYLTLEPSSIDIFHRFPQKKDVELETKLKFSRLFTYITDWKQYLQILAIAGKKPIEIEKRFEKEIMSLSAQQINELIRQRDTQNMTKTGSREKKYGESYKRDHILSLCLKRRYRDSCQIMSCRSDIKIGHGFFTDTHHIVPLGKGGTDTSSNIIVLCPNHHRLFHRSKVKLVDRTVSKVTLEVNGTILKARVKR